jgi:hypothetical protein
MGSFKKQDLVKQMVFINTVKDYISNMFVERRQYYSSINYTIQKRYIRVYGKVFPHLIDSMGIISTTLNFGGNLIGDELTLCFIDTKDMCGDVYNSVSNRPARFVTHKLNIFN